MIHVQAKGNEIGCGILEGGNVGVFTIDKQSGIMVTIEFEPASWKRFLEQAPRLKGVGIAGLAPLIIPGADGGG